MEFWLMFGIALLMLLIALPAAALALDQLYERRVRRQSRHHRARHSKKRL